MKKKKSFKNKLLHTPFDVSMILDLVFLNVFGIVMIYSASYFYAQSAYGYEASYFFRNQLQYVLIGFVFFLAVSYIRPAFYRAVAPYMIILCYLAVVAVRVPGLGRESHGAYRWVVIAGQSLQVAEPIKIGFILFLGYLFAVFDINKGHTFIVWSVITVSLAGLVFVLTDNFSTAVIIAGTSYLMALLNSRHAKKYLAGILIVVFIALLVLVLLLRSPYSPEESFRITRIRAWLYPENELFADDTAYQSTQAFYAIARGGFFGRGLGQSLIKFKLPEPHNDFILSIIFEELGIFGVLLLTYLFVYLLYRIFRIYTETKDRFSKNLVLGVFLHLSLQILLNYAVTLGLVPTTGVTLPFISAGGSAAFFTLLELALCMSVHRQNAEDRLYEEIKAERMESDAYYRALDYEMQSKKRKVGR